LLDHLYSATYAIEESLYRSESKSGEPITMLNDNSFDLAFAGSIEDLEKLMAVVIQTGGDFGAVKDNSITTLTTRLNKPFVLAR
jgi:hypothetical protein